MLITGARLTSASDPVDVSVRDGRIIGIGPAAGPATEGHEVALDGRFLRPGLWDSHVHFRQYAGVRRRLDLTWALSAREAVDTVSALLRASRRAILGYGFRDGLWPDEPSTAMLDAIAPDVAVVLVSGDLHCGWLNSAALAQFGLPRDTTGLVREGDWIPVLNRLDALHPDPGDTALREAAQAAASRGVVGIVDFETDDNLAEWPARLEPGFPPLRVEAAIWPWHLEQAVAAGRRTGDAVQGTDGLVTVGPLKIVVDGSLNTRTAFCVDPYPGLEGRADACGVLSVPADELRGLMRAADDAGLGLAVHAIGDRANSLVLDAYADLGITGTIEHAQLVTAEDIPRFAQLGVTASIQPEHAMDDRDVADRYWAGRTDRAFAYRSLVESGAAIRLGSDAPVAPLDPWIAIDAAVGRARDGREAWHPEQSIGLETALAASARGRTSLREGDRADLIVLDADPSTATELRTMPVAGTLVAGQWSWRAF
ncbi:amidohydrolase family protein [Okibacterium endophyticum]